MRSIHDGVSIELGGGRTKTIKYEHANLLDAADVIEIQGGSESDDLFWAKIAEPYTEDDFLFALDLVEVDEVEARRAAIRTAIANAQRTG